MISIITALEAPNRVKALVALNKQLHEKTNMPFEHIIVVDGNKETYREIKKDIDDNVYLLPENREWVHAMNYGYTKARYEYVMHIDEDCSIRTNHILELVLKAHKKQWSNGMGVLGFYDGEGNCARWLTTKKYSAMLSDGHFMWPEYIHGGDHEVYQHSKARKEYYWEPEAYIIEEKIDDDSRKKSLSLTVFDDWLYHEREQRGFPNELNIHVQGKMKEMMRTNEHMKALYETYYKANWSGYLFPTRENYE